MTFQATRAVLIRKYLRTAGESRVPGLLARLPANSMAALFHQLDDRELRVIASALLKDEELTTTAANYPDDALVVLLEAAYDDDAITLFAHIGKKRALRLTRELSEVRSHALMCRVDQLKKDAHTTEAQGPVASVLRMRRLFA
jgi:hypothetical protein